MPQLALQKPTWRAPAPPEWSLLPLEEAYTALKEHLQTAIILELYTIPLYLFAAYSIIESPLSTYKIIGVVKQEMLHLGLAGNILCSIGGTPRVYGDKYTPKYPREIFFEKLEMNLHKGSKETIGTFMKLEEPSAVSNHRRAEEPEVPLLPEYRTIGDFYQHLDSGMKIVDKRYKNAGMELFKSNTFAKQLQTSDGSWYDPDMKVITEIKVAAAALNIIITQGEGALEGKDPASAFQSHYEVFKELHGEHELNCYPVVENPKTKDFAGQEIHKVMVACDAAYSYLLLTMEKLWAYDGDQRGRLVTNNIMNLMLTILKPMALFLVQQPGEGEYVGKNMAAAYNRHDFNGAPLQELKTLTDVALRAYPNASKLQAVRPYVEELIDISALK